MAERNRSERSQIALIRRDVTVAPNVLRSQEKRDFERPLKSRDKFGCPIYVYVTKVMPQLSWRFN